MYEAKMENIKRRLSNALSGDSSTNSAKPKNRRGALGAFHFKRASVAKSLVAAAEAGDATKIRELLEDGPDLADIENTEKAVRAACAGGHLEVMAVLIRFGAVVNTLGDDNASPLHVAVRHNAPEIITLLINNGVNVNIQTKFEKRAPVHVAATFGRDNALKALQEAGVKLYLDIRDIYGSTPLHLATRMGHTSVVNLLLNEKGRVDVNAYDNDGWTAMHLAAEKGDKELVQLLIDHHAQIDCQNKYGRTPLQWAVMKGHTQVVHLLLRFHASATHLDLHNKSALDYATDPKIKQLLLMTSPPSKLPLQPADSTIGDYVKIEARGSFIRRLADPIPAIIRITASVKERKKAEVTPAENMESIAEESESRRSSSYSENGSLPDLNGADDSTSNINKGSLLRTLFKKISSESQSKSRQNSLKSNVSRDDECSSDISGVTSRLVDPVEREVSNELLTIPRLRCDSDASILSAIRQSPVAERRGSVTRLLRQQSIDIPDESSMGQEQFHTLLSKLERHHATIEELVASVSSEVTKAATGKQNMSNTNLMNISNKMQRVQDLISNFREEVTQQKTVLDQALETFLESIRGRLSWKDVLPVGLYHAFIHSAVYYLEGRHNSYSLLVQKMSGISEETKSDILDAVTNTSASNSQKCSHAIYLCLENFPERHRVAPLRALLLLLMKCKFSNEPAKTVINKFIDIINPNQQRSLAHDKLMLISYRLGAHGKDLAEHFKIPIPEVNNNSDTDAPQKPNHQHNLEVLLKWRQMTSHLNARDSLYELVESLILIGREDLLRWILCKTKTDRDENQSKC